MRDVWEANQYDLFYLRQINTQRTSLSLPAIYLTHVHYRDFRIISLNKQIKK